MRTCAGHEGHACEVRIDSGANGKRKRCASCVEGHRRSYQRKWKNANRERVNELGREYHERHRDRVNAQHREYYRSDPEREAARARAYREANREQVRERAKAYRERTPDQQRAYHRKHDPLKKARRRARRAGAFDDGTWPAKPPQAECQHCGATENLHRDHIVPLSNGGDHTLANCQALCQTCNSRKGNRYTG